MNDIIYYGFVVVFGVLIVILPMLLHEYGHKRALEKYTGKKIKIYKDKTGLQTGTEEDYKGLSDREYRSVIWNGVMYGLLPYVFIVFFRGYTVIFIVGILSLINYVICCRKDFQYFINSCSDDKCG